jgi:hypothetical protein
MEPVRPNNNWESYQNSLISDLTSQIQRLKFENQLLRDQVGYLDSKEIINESTYYNPDSLANVRFGCAEQVTSLHNMGLSDYYDTAFEIADDIIRQATNKLEELVKEHGLFRQMESVELTVFKTRKVIQECSNNIPYDDTYAIIDRIMIRFHGSRNSDVREYFVEFLHKVPLVQFMSSYKDLSMCIRD